MAEKSSKDKYANPASMQSKRIPGNWPTDQSRKEMAATKEAAKEKKKSSPVEQGVKASPHVKATPAAAATPSSPPPSPLEDASSELATAKASLEELEEKVAKPQEAEAAKAGGKNETKGGEPVDKKFRRYPPCPSHDGKLTADDLNAMVPAGCQFGDDRNNARWLLTAYGTKYSRSCNLSGASGAGLELVKVAWTIALKEAYEDECPYPHIGLEKPHSRHRVFQFC